MKNKFKYLSLALILFFIFLVSFLVLHTKYKIFNFSFLTEIGNILLTVMLLIMIVFIVTNIFLFQVQKEIKQLKLSIEKLNELEHENKILKEKVETQRRLYEDKDTEHRIILRLIMLVLQTVELKKVLNLSLEILCNFLHYDRAFVFLFDRTKNVLQCISGYNVNSQNIEGIVVDINKQNNFITKTALKRKPYIAGAIQDFNVNFQIFDNISHPNTIASIPLEAKNKVIGVLVVDNIKTKRRILQSDLRKLIEFADIIGLAIENARLYETEKNFSEQLNIKLNEAIQKLKETQQQVIRAETLAALGRMATIVSHEIRNMLTSIKNSAEVLLETVNEPEKIKYIEYILNETKHLNKVVDDILSVGQKIHIVPFPVDVNKFIIEVLQTIELMDIEKEGIKIILELDPNLPTGFFDYDRMKQVFINILQNAIYFLRSAIKKEIKIKTYIENSDIVISISDTGCGIPQDIKDKIFDPFFTTKPNGTGLGLTICRNIVLAHGGDITVESEYGKGANFIIKLPIRNF